MNAFTSEASPILANAGTWIEDRRVDLFWQRRSVLACRTCGGLRTWVADGWADSVAEPCEACLGTGFQLPQEFAPARPRPALRVSARRARPRVDWRREAYEAAVCVALGAGIVIACAIAIRMGSW